MHLTTVGPYLGLMHSNHRQPSCNVIRAAFHRAEIDDSHLASTAPPEHGNQTRTAL